VNGEEKVMNKGKDRKGEDQVYQVYQLSGMIPEVHAFLYKNPVYKNVEAQIFLKIRTS